MAPEIATFVGKMARRKPRICKDAHRLVPIGSAEILSRPNGHAASQVCAWSIESAVKVKFRGGPRTESAEVPYGGHLLQKVGCFRVYQILAINLRSVLPDHAEEVLSRLLSPVSL